MSNPDSFIQEVTDEVRRDRLTRMLRRYGWIILLALVAIVGAAAWSEWSKGQARAQAQAFGDGIVAALNAPEPEARAAGLAALTAQSEGQALILELMRAANAVSQEDLEGAAATWSALAETPNLPTLYRHLALLKAQLAGGTGTPEADARLLDELANPGAPFRALALELQGMGLIAAGDREGAILRLRAAGEDAGASDTLQRRVTQVIVALGGSADPA